MDKRRVEDVVTDTVAEVATRQKERSIKAKKCSRVFRQALEKHWERPLPWCARCLQPVVKRLRRPGMLFRVSLARWEARPVKRRLRSISKALGPEGI